MRTWHNSALFGLLKTKKTVPEVTVNYIRCCYKQAVSLLRVRNHYFGNDSKLRQQNRIEEPEVFFLSANYAHFHFHNQT